MIKTINKIYNIIIQFFVICYWSGPQIRIQSKNFVITTMWQYLFEKLPSYMELSNDNSKRERIKKKYYYVYLYICLLHSSIYLQFI